MGDLIDAILDFINKNPLTVSIVMTISGGIIGYCVKIGRFLTQSLSLKNQLKDERKKVQDAERINAAINSRNEELSLELAKFSEIGVFREWLFFAHDPAPRAPLCPRCHADGKNNRMHLQPGPISEQNYILSFLCVKCGFNVMFDSKETQDDQLFVRLGWNQSPSGTD
ncbi:MAG: hypothetical protein LBT97_03820 [Planctomycetota bacterium]|jgi:hypothetical protein|nr:hypothetical protein [Planctomycetota bacterium]